MLLFGRNGQVGWELQRGLAPLGSLIALDAKSDRYCGDLADLKGLTATIREISPDVIVNAAAYTAVDQAEVEPEVAQRINADAVALMASEASRTDAWLVHYSTDYVFDGHGNKPWNESDAVGPLNCYGRTKLAGETFVLESGCKHLIFRTSWVYAPRRKNFVNTIFRLAKEKDYLSVIDDQYGAPTGADLVADVTAQALRIVRKSAEFSGSYHLAAAGETTWCEYARFLLTQMERCGVSQKAKSDDVRSITSAEYPMPARRPLNSRLCTKKLRKDFGLHLPDWEVGVARTVQELALQCQVQ